MKRIIIIAISLLMLISLISCNSDIPVNNTSIGKTESSGESTVEPKTTDLTFSTAGSKIDTTSEQSSSETVGEDVNNTKNNTSTVSSENSAESTTTSEETYNPKSPNEKEETTTPNTEEATKPTTEKKEPSQTETTTEKEESEPEEPKPQTSAYAYPFNIEQIRQDCIAIAKSYGMKLDESLNKNNSSWANPDSASPKTQGDRLKRLLKETIVYYTDDYREDMGLTLLHIEYFNIYCEPMGDGSYLIYFLH